MHDLIGSVGLSDIRPIEEEDLLGRRALHLDIDSVADYLTGRRSSEDGRGTRILDPERDILRERLAEARREGRWNPGWDRYWARGLAERP